MDLLQYIGETFNIEELKKIANLPKFEYIRELGNVIGRSGKWTSLLNFESGYDAVFALRTALDQISDDEEKKQQFLKDKDLQAILEYYGLDPDKFWYLSLFIVDYIDDLYTSATIREEFQALIDEVEQMTDDGKLSLKVDDRNTVKIEHTDAIRFMAQVLKAYLESHDTDKALFLDKESRKLDANLDKARYNKLSDTYRAFFFDQLFSIFLKGKKKVNDTGKRSKKELIAKMAYILEIVSNRQVLENFVVDETLNNYIKGVNKDIEVKHKIYRKQTDSIFRG